MLKLSNRLIKILVYLLFLLRMKRMPINWLWIKFNNYLEVFLKQYFSKFLKKYINGVIKSNLCIVMEDWLSLKVISIMIPKIFEFLYAMCFFLFSFFFNWSHSKSVTRIIFPITISKFTVCYRFMYADIYAFVLFFFFEKLNIIYLFQIVFI